MSTIDNIRNFAIIAHIDHGKSTIADRIIHNCGGLTEREMKAQVLDSMDIERERGITIKAQTVKLNYKAKDGKEYILNIIDTPGLDDFIGEIMSSIRVADTIVTVINAKHGVDIGTEINWNYVDRYHKPTLFVINKIDSEKANFEKSFSSLKELVGNNAVLVQYPIKIDGAQCIIDVLKMKCYKFGSEGGKPEKLPIPDDQLEKANALHNELVEKAAENDEDLMEIYFEKGNLNEDELRKGLKIGMINQKIQLVIPINSPA